MDISFRLHFLRRLISKRAANEGQSACTIASPCEPLEPRTLLASVTLVTHGWDGDMRWVNEMANQIAEDIDPSGMTVSRVQLRVSEKSAGEFPMSVRLSTGRVPTRPGAPNLIIALDWTSEDTDLWIGTGEIARAVAGALTRPDLWSQVGFGTAPAQFPLHLIGHSRGGSLVSALASDLGTRGIWVDHLTLLDPRPAVEYGYDDALLRVTSNVVFSDNYWRQNSVPLDMNGRPAPHGLNVNLSGRSFSGGHGTDHSDVRLWYFGTIDTIGTAFDSLETLTESMRSRWYLPEEVGGSRTGFHFSRHREGTRPFAYLGSAFGGFDTRNAVTPNGPQWPNIDRVTTDWASAGLAPGSRVAVEYWVQDPDSPAQISFFLDPDADPFNGMGTPVGGATVNAPLPILAEQRNLSFTLPGLTPGTYRLLAHITDASGLSRTSAAASVLTVLPSRAASAAPAALTPDQNPTVLTVSVDGSALALLPGPAGTWRAERPALPAGSGFPMTPAVTWTDARTGVFHGAIATDRALLLLSRSTPAGAWSVSDLASTVPGAVAIQRALARFASVDGATHLAGLSAEGHLLLYRQIGSSGWTFENLTTAHLAPQGQQTPDFVGDTVAYTTAWNGMNIAGVDPSGNIHAVWWAPGRSLWSAANLSQITGAPRASGGISVFVTNWSAINLTTTDDVGNVLVTWWMPGRAWETSNMTASFAGARLQPGRISSYVTPWNALNIAGVDESGSLSVYWWVPGMSAWSFSRLTAGIDRPARFAGPISPVSSTDATISLFGVDADSRRVIRYWWQPAFGGQWQLQDVSRAAGIG